MEMKHTVRNCAGPQLIAHPELPTDIKIVAWIDGGEHLQKDNPNLKVLDDRLLTCVIGGKFLSSNENLTSYIPSLNLVGFMTSPGHRNFV